MLKSSCYRWPRKGDHDKDTLNGFAVGSNDDFLMSKDIDFFILLDFIGLDRLQKNGVNGSCCERYRS